MAAAPQFGMRTFVTPGGEETTPYKLGHRLTEYRIPLPMAVEEYQIGQLYTITAASQEMTEESSESVELLTYARHGGGVWLLGAGHGI